MTDKVQIQIFTIGHSTRSVDELIEVLTSYNVAALVDVRHFPSSKRHPQFNKNNLEIKLPEWDVIHIFDKKRLQLHKLRKEH